MLTNVVCIVPEQIHAMKNLVFLFLQVGFSIASNCQHETMSVKGTEVASTMVKQQFHCCLSTWIYAWSSRFGTQWSQNVTVKILEVNFH